MWMYRKQKPDLGRLGCASNAPATHDSALKQVGSGQISGTPLGSVTLVAAAECQAQCATPIKTYPTKK